MRISFDLDDTLICYHDGVPREPRLPWWWRSLTSEEPLRLGTRELLTALRSRGWEVWIYTTSYRSPQTVRWWLWCHGIRVGRVINQDVHDRHLRRTPRDYPPTKHPRAFGIDLHVDDSEGVREEGLVHGFRVVVVSPGDPDWAARVSRVAAEYEPRRPDRPG